MHFIGFLVSFYSFTKHKWFLMTKDYKAFFLTLIQYTTLPLMMWMMTWFAENLLLLIIQLLGLIVASWAIFEMQKSKINIAPTPREGATLVDTGIYKWIRHPMYTSLLMVFIPMIIENQTTINLALFLFFAINLILKLEYEETLLVQFFPNYQDYKKRSFKIIPYIY